MKLKAQKQIRTQNWFTIRNKKKHFMITRSGRPFENQKFLYIKQTFFVWFSDHHSKTRQFDNQTLLDHLNTRLVRYSRWLQYYILYLNILSGYKVLSIWQFFGNDLTASKMCHTLHFLLNRWTLLSMHRALDNFQTHIRDAIFPPDRINFPQASPSDAGIKWVKWPIL